MWGLRVGLSVVAVLLLGGSDRGWAAPPSPRFVTLLRFERDPLAGGGATVEGDAGRLSWKASAPVFAGDPPGAVSADYQSDRLAARLGFPLAWPLSEDDDFTAAVVLVIRPERFGADPNGYFQISWGLWNGATTGLERTGQPANFASDSFDLLEWNYFPNVSPYFGGPFINPVILGAADRQNRLFASLGAFANASFGSAQVELPLAAPLLVWLQYDRTMRALRTALWHVQPNGEIEELTAARAVAVLDGMSLPQFSLTRVGLTLWHDGFGGASPALTATVDYHLLAVASGKVDASELLDRALQRRGR